MLADLLDLDPPETAVSMMGRGIKLNANDLPVEQLQGVQTTQHEAND